LQNLRVEVAVEESHRRDQGTGIKEDGGARKVLYRGMGYRIG
jgi:hypothetical protein